MAKKAAKRAPKRAAKAKTTETPKVETPTPQAAPEPQPEQVSAPAPEPEPPPPVGEPELIETVIRPEPERKLPPMNTTDGLWSNEIVYELRQIRRLLEERG